MNSKGITPVIATVLLITISIAATGTAYTYITGAQDEAQSSFEDQLGDQQQQEQSDINIQRMYESSGGFALINIRNSGEIDQYIENDNGLKYWNLYIDGRPVGSDATGWKYIGSTPSTPVRLKPSATININSTEPFPNPSAGSSVQKEFKIVGRYGSEDTHTCYVQDSSVSSC